MSHKIIGVTVGTPTSPAKMRRELKPVQTINGVEPDETGNVQVETGSGSPGKTIASIEITENIDGAIVMKNTFTDGNYETIVIPAGEEPSHVLYNGIQIPITWKVIE